MYSVLIVEDEEMERCFLQSVVEKELASNAAVYSCESGMQAVSMARKYRPDIVFMDIFLPELDGIGVTVEIQKFLPDVCECILTACSDFSYAQKAVSLHVFQYILKPVRPSDFKTVLSQMIELVDEQRVRKNNGGNAAVAEQQQEQEPFIANSVGYIRKHFQERLTLQDVSLRVFMNPQYFSRVFKRKTGMTFTRFINDLRIQYACKLLETTNYPAYRIANECGFTDASYFNRVFYKQMNMTPKEYRRYTYEHVQ